MKCKYCQAEMPENETVCPACGEVNETAAPAVQTKVIKATPGVIALAGTIIVLLAAVLVALVVGGLSSAAPAPTEPDASVTADPTGASDPSGEATVPPTTPADTGLEDETHKGTYSADDATVADARQTVVATMGDAHLTNGELQVFYWMEVSGFYSQYYSYAPYLGLDFSRPLDSQICTLVEPAVSWQQYFLKCALTNWKNYQSLLLEAEKSGFQVTDETREFLDNYSDEFTAEANNAGYEDVALYVYDNLGAGAELEDYLHFLNVVYTGSEYFDSLTAQYNPTDAEVEAYLDEHAEELAAQGITKNSCTVDVRHVLIFPEGATSETIRTETFSEDAWAASKTKAENLLAQWEAGEKTEDSFGALANEHSDDNGGNVTNGGLYEGVTPGQMVTNFNDWCFDPERQVGDYGIVTTEFGNHIMYLSGKTYTWMDSTRTAMINANSSKLLGEALEKYETKVDYKSILLGTAGVFTAVG